MRNSRGRILSVVGLITTLTIVVVAAGSGAQSDGLKGHAQGIEKALSLPTKDWPTVGGDWSNGRYSGLAQINTKNIKNLSGAWIRELDTPTRATPIVTDGVMFIPDASHIYALNPSSGEIIWSYRSAGLVIAA